MTRSVGLHETKNKIFNFFIHKSPYCTSFGTLIKTHLTHIDSAARHAELGLEKRGLVAMLHLCYYSLVTIIKQYVSFDLIHVEYWKCEIDQTYFS